MKPSTNHKTTGIIGIGLRALCMLALTLASAHALIPVYTETFPSDVNPFPGVDLNYSEWTFTTNGNVSGSVSGGQFRIASGLTGSSGLALVTSSGTIGQSTFGNTIIVDADLGGANVFAGNWNVGLRVGNLNLIFHPGYSGGAFRVNGITGNADIGYTPIGLQHMTVLVEASGVANKRVNVNLTDGVNSFATNFFFSNATVGTLNQVGLERNGAGIGGDFGVFDNLIISVPEPSSLALLVLGSVLWLRKVRK